MAEQQKPVELKGTSPKGRFRYPYLVTPDFGTDEHPIKSGQYAVRLVVDEATAEAFTKKLQPVIDYAASHDKGILIKKALASGHICLQPGQDPVQASFELIFARPGVTSVIIGTLNAEHLHHNVAVMAGILRSQSPL